MDCEGVVNLARELIGPNTGHSDSANLLSHLITSYGIAKQITDQILSNFLKSSYQELFLIDLRLHVSERIVLLDRLFYNMHEFQRNQHKYLDVTFSKALQPMDFDKHFRCKQITLSFFTKLKLRL